MVRRILFSLIILLALLLAAEIGVTYLSEHGVEKALSSQYDLPSNLKAGINSFPFIVSLARNHLGELDLRWDGELDYPVQEGMTESIPYMAHVELYDVELSMPSLLKGKLEIRNISRIKADIAISLDTINDVFSLPGEGIFTEDGKLYMIIGGKKTQLKVKVSGDRELIIETYSSFINDTESSENPDAGIQDVILHVVFDELPMSAKLQSAGLEGDNVVIEFSVPMWEGYL